MTPTTNQNSKDIVSLREYFESRLDSMDRQTEIARAGMEKRLDGMNEFRQSLRDQNDTFLPKTEYKAWKMSVDEDIRSLRETRSELAGKASQTQVLLSFGFSLFGVVMAIISLLR